MRSAAVSFPITKVSVTAYEGDWASDGDQMLVNDTSIAGRNAFTSSALGATHPNNMSVDARTVTVPEDVLRELGIRVIARAGTKDEGA